jgi:hypothetical protein
MSAEFRSPITWLFDSTERGWVLASIGEDYPGFNETLEDSIGCLSPARQPPGLSTYWVDKALEGAVRAEPGRSFSGGNTTSLARSELGVIAHSDYELFEDEEIGLDDFLIGMREWRRQIQAAIQRGQALTLRPGVWYFAQKNPGPVSPN